MAESEGAAVRRAMDGPELDHDELIGNIEARLAEEYERSSDASESGAKIKQFIEKTELNSKAYTWLKAILKVLEKKDGQAKAMDIIRSIEAGLPMVKNHVAGQGSMEMDLGDPDPVEIADDDDGIPPPGDDIEAETEGFEDAVADLGEPAPERKVIQAFGG